MQTAPFLLYRIKLMLIAPRPGAGVFVRKLDIIFSNLKGGLKLSESEREFHKETTFITPGIDLKKKKTNVGKKKTDTAVFNDAETKNI